MYSHLSAIATDESDGVVIESPGLGCWLETSETGARALTAEELGLFWLTGVDVETAREEVLPG